MSHIIHIFIHNKKKRKTKIRNRTRIGDRFPRFSRLYRTHIRNISRWLQINSTSRFAKKQTGTTRFAEGFRNPRLKEEAQRRISRVWERNQERRKNGRYVRFVLVCLRALDLNINLPLCWFFSQELKLWFDLDFAVRTKKPVSGRRKKTKTKDKKPWRPWRLLTLFAYRNHPFQLFLLKDLSLIFPPQTSSALIKISLTDYLSEDFEYLPTLLQHPLVMQIDFIVLLSTEEQGI
jgi:hypothetical protein